MLTSKPTSGLSFRERIDRERSRRNSVAGRGASGAAASGSAVYASLSNRFDGLSAAPRPWIAPRYPCIDVIDPLRGENIAKVKLTLHGLLAVAPGPFESKMMAET